MIVTLIVILYLGYQTYKGYQLGFAQRVINMIFGAIVFAAAILGQNSLGNWFYQQFSGKVVPTTGNISLEIIGYRFLAFFVIWFIGKMILKICKGWLPKRDRTKKGIGNLLDNVLGAIVSFIAPKTLSNRLPIPFLVRSRLGSQPLQIFKIILRVIIYNTPGLSNGVFKTIFGISRTVG